MKILDTLESLENSWSREKILKQLKNGVNPENIINEFLKNNRADIENLSNSFQPKDKQLLKHLEELSTCEAKLINKINNLDIGKDILYQQEKRMSKTSILMKLITENLPLFMLKWSNKFVVITLVTISAIALSKQAWA